MRIVESLEKKLTMEEVTYNYFYRVIETTFEGNKFYGIEVERQDYEKEKLTSIGREYIKYVAVNENETIEILQKLCDNLVSPIHLIDIVGEMSDRNIEKYSNKEILIYS
ncbi:MAG: DUF6514 family protein [Sarcina sp.]